MRKLLLFFLALLLFSCEKSGFEFSSARLVLNKVEDVETLDFSISLSNEENGYMLSISSPEGLLRWEGALEVREDGLYGLSLEITEGSSFPSGEYSFSIYSSGGVERSGSVLFLREDFHVSLSDGVISGEMRGHATIGGRDVALGSTAEEGDLLIYTDEYFNTYEIIL